MEHTRKRHTRGRFSSSSSSSFLPAVFLAAVVLLFIGGCSEKPESIDISGLEAEVKDILSIPSYEYIYRDVIYIGEERSFIVFKTMDRRVLFSVDLAVTAGLDLEKGFTVEPGAGRGGVSGNTGGPGAAGVIITLPRAEILSIDADERTIHQYFAKEMGGSISRLEYYNEIDRKKEEIRRDAIERGILQQAENNAGKIISRIFAAAGVEDIRIIWTGGRE